MDKPGIALDGIDAFSDDAVARLRDQLSVTTAEEFVDLAQRYPDSIARVLGVDRPAVDDLTRAASAAAPMADEPAAGSEPAPADDYPFATGLDAPPEGHETFEP
jgi:hypothetical protein